MKVFLTGASSGLGEALVEAFVRLARKQAAIPGVTPAQSATDRTRSGSGSGSAGSLVLGLAARRGDALAAFAAAHPDCTVATYPLDVTDTAALAAAATDFIARFGMPDIVIANAGISAGSVSGLGDLAVFKQVMDTNYLGMMATFEPFVTPMRMQRKGTLVGIASVAGVRGLPGAGAYSASKAAAIRVLESLRVELRRTGVSVVTIAPGYIRTPMTDRNPYPMPFLMEPDDFADRAVAAILARRRFVVLPWQMGWVAKMLHLMPRALYDLAFSRAPHKPRQPTQD